MPRAQTRSRVRGGGSDGPVPLLESRLTPPPLRPGLVARDLLLERLRGSDASIAVVAAGAGYGKTTLLAQLAEADKRPIAWLSLDETDNDPIVLLTYLVAALAQAVPIDPRIYELLLVRSSAPIPSDGLRWVASTISNAPSPFLLVIDDVHTLTDPVAVDVLATILRETPPGSLIALAGRSVSIRPLARLRSQGRLCEIGPEDLALDAGETSALLSAAGISLQDDHVTGLARRTEGWPAGIYLAALAIAAGGEPKQVAAQGGPDPFVADYLRAEILARLDDDDVSFLTEASILERLSAPLCDAVLERTDSASRLAGLARTNLFVIPLDHQGTWYRCHQLFRDLLREDLAARPPADVAALHRRAATWLEDNHRLDEAIEHAHLAGDIDTAARLVGANAQSTVAHGRSATALRWLERFDDASLTRWPTLASLGAWVHVIRGDAVHAARFADLAETGDDRAPVLDGSASAASARAMLRAAMCRRGIESMRSDAARAYELEPASSPWRPLAVTLLGVATLLDGDAAAAEVLFAEATDVMGPAGKNPTVATAWAERAALSIERDDRRDVAQAVERSKQIAAEAHLEAYTTSGLTFAVGARSAMQAGDLEGARRDLASAQRLRPYVTRAMPWLAIQMRLEMAHALLGLAEVAGAQTLLIEIDGILRTHPDMGTLRARAEDLRTRTAGQSGGAGGAATLTGAELRLLPLLPTHLSFPEIGQRLFISRSTVKTQAISIYRKLGVSSRNEAVERAREVGLLPQ